MRNKWTVDCDSSVAVTGGSGVGEVGQGKEGQVCANGGRLDWVANTQCSAQMMCYRAVHSKSI